MSPTLHEFARSWQGVCHQFPWQVKSTLMIKKGGISLKPFLHQLQTTFVKCLQDSTRTVRSSAALALGKLSGLSTRVDPLVSDLLSSLQGSDGGVQEAILIALKGVLKHAGKNVSLAVRTRFYNVLKDLIHHDDDQVRIFASSILGILAQVCRLLNGFVFTDVFVFLWIFITYLNDYNMLLFYFV